MARWRDDARAAALPGRTTPHAERDAAADADAERLEGGGAADCAGGLRDDMILSLSSSSTACLSVQSFDERKGGKGEAGRWEKCVVCAVWDGYERSRQKEEDFRCVVPWREGCGWEGLYGAESVCANSSLPREQEQERGARAVCVSGGMMVCKGQR